MADTKRRLPVLNSEPAEEARPPWHWVGFGTVMILTVWLPLAYAGEAIVTRARPAGPVPTAGGWFFAAMLAVIAPLAVAAVAGGFLVGRFGGGAGRREALFAGLATGAIAVILTTLSTGFSPLFLIVVVLTGLFAGLGGAYGVRKRAP